MNVTLWILQAVLAAMFGMAGVMKSTQPKDKLAEKLPWVKDFSPGVVKVIGVAELAAALGLILPAALDIAPVLTPLAATGLVVIMLGAIITHARRKEPQAIAFNVVLLIVAAVVAWGRFGPYAF
ncbi:DoxX family protein [Amycolatopsis mediterranei S699]|uniref:DoxX family protein n=2 Tax=Amycolatopsis mediterranei TaxID=33910 RepID=A0A0H3DF79_AMYMU|nr:DoxX family protein [Amycolatopsis mediterranei]ADJ48867.1 DoxX family protein [Amycolatopsis mediterranei U32]AEK45816.1 DoxX family protein [Amycolatopsis mediterranei S699]AFO80575.1 DoxX family protein [Amycolatopsis mediterranei S699]AGT87703.1 DoxX family protein [Amycolatopsis mediterranei RB]KDU94018.1 DoxX family protein [Amycolatopsis mediterranei]